MSSVGIDADFERAIGGCDRVYVAFDCDVVRPGELAVFMPEPGGSGLAEAEALLGDIAGKTTLAGLGLTGLTGDADPDLVARLAAAAGL